MAEDTVFQKQQFGQSIGIGRRPALLIVDFVNGFLDPEMFGGGNIIEAATNTQTLLAAARSGGHPVVFTRIVYAEDGSDAGIWCVKVPRLKLLTESAPASQVTDILDPRPGELVVSKTQASAFFGTGLNEALARWDVDTLFIAGCTTSGCVRASVVDAISYNYRPVMVGDCVGDRDESAHTASLLDIGHKYADLMTLDEAAGRLSGRQDG